MRLSPRDATAASAWGLLRNALQEFPALAWSGSDGGRVPVRGPAGEAPTGPQPRPDAFGAASAGGAWALPRMLPERAPHPAPNPMTAAARAGAGAGRGAPPPGAWLITGGTGGLGRLCAQWAALCGAPHLLLFDAAAGALPAALAACQGGLPAAVTVARGDMATREGARAAGGGRHAPFGGGPALQGIVHAAGVLQARCPAGWESASQWADGVCTLRVRVCRLSYYQSSDSHCFCSTPFLTQVGGADAHPPQPGRFPHPLP